MGVVDPEDTAELKSLQAALGKARAQTVLPHPAKQAEDCQAYCTRAARRLENARAAVVVVREAVPSCMKDCRGWNCGPGGRGEFVAFGGGTVFVDEFRPQHQSTIHPPWCKPSPEGSGVLDTLIDEADTDHRWVHGRFVPY